LNERDVPQLRKKKQGEKVVDLNLKPGMLKALPGDPHMLRGLSGDVPTKSGTA
jgi:hypothetical protein